MVVAQSFVAASSPVPVGPDHGVKRLEAWSHGAFGKHSEKLLAALPMRRPLLAAARAAALDYFAADPALAKRTLLEWLPSTAEEIDVYCVDQQVDILWGGPDAAGATQGPPV